mgnify:CR=1 FL=1
MDLDMQKIFDQKSKEELLKMLITPTSERHFIMYEALRKGATVDEIHEITKVKKYFIEQMKRTCGRGRSTSAAQRNTSIRRSTYSGKEKTDSQINTSARFWKSMKTK